MTKPSFTFNALLRDVHDADTFTLDIDLGFFVHVVQACRLHGCNAPEIATEAGVAARAALLELMPLGSRVVITSIKPDKYGERFDAAVSVNRLDVTAAMVSTGNAATWNAQGTKPTPPWPIPAGTMSMKQYVASHSKPTVAADGAGHQKDHAEDKSPPDQMAGESKAATGQDDEQGEK